MSIRTLLASFLALGLAAQPAPPPQGARGAQGPRGFRDRAAGENLAFLAHHLKLSEAQRTQIKAIHTRHQEAIQAKQRSAMEAREALMKAAAKPDAAVADLRALHQAAADRQFEVMVERRAVRQEARALLTPEQRAESDRMQALGEERRQFRMHRMRGAMEGRQGRGFGPGGGIEGPEGPFED
jgi:Spy/CpxP family protein refolding chaperone